jgi:hypothetical protein
MGKGEKERKRGENQFEIAHRLVKSKTRRIG